MRTLFIRIALALLLGTSAAMAETTSQLTEPIVSRLQEEGYVVVQIKRTWLGRILIISQNGEFLREVVINPHTGEILRDKLFALDGSNGAVAPMPDSMPDSMPGSMPDNGGRGSRGGGMNGGSDRGGMKGGN